MSSPDPIVRGIIAIREEISRRTDDLAATTFEGMYAVGRLQGVVDGLKLACRVLEDVLRDDNQFSK